MLIKMRNILAKTAVLFLLAGLILSIFPASIALADSNSGKCGENLTWTLDGNGTLTIKGSGDMYRYGSTPAN